MFRRHSKIFELIKPVHHRIVSTKSSRRIFSQYLPFQSWILTLKCERCTKLIRKTLARRESVVVVYLLGIGSILILITSHLDNTANHAIAKNSCKGYFKKFEVLFSRKQQGPIRTDWKIISCIFYHLCMVLTIFQVAPSLSISSTTQPSLAQHRKQ